MDEIIHMQAQSTAAVLLHVRISYKTRDVITYACPKLS